jgi:hypothetical protein
MTNQARTIKLLLDAQASNLELISRLQDENRSLCRWIRQHMLYVHPLDNETPMSDAPLDTYTA